MMPVISPAAGGAPEAIAMPIHSGNATRKTTTEASKSRANGAPSLFISSFFGRNGGGARDPLRFVGQRTGFSVRGPTNQGYDPSWVFGDGQRKLDRANKP